MLLSGLWDRKAGIIKPSKEKEDKKMRGYFTAGGYYGMVDGRYLLFSDETEYFEYLANYDRDGLAHMIRELQQVELNKMKEYGV